MPWTQEYRYKIMLTQLKGERQDLWECHGQDTSQYYVSLKSSNIVEANIPMKSRSPILERWSAEAALAEKWPDVAVNQHTNQTIKCNLNMAMPSRNPIEMLNTEESIWKNFMHEAPTIMPSLGAPQLVYVWRQTSLGATANWIKLIKGHWNISA